MKVIALFLLSWNVAFTAKYYMELDHFLHRGVLDFPDYGGILTLQGVLIFYNDKHGVNVQHDWVKELIKENTQFWETFVYGCLDYKPAFRAETANFSKQSNQSEGNEIIQQIIGCDWDDEIHKTYGHIEYGNNGEDFITLDVKTGTWIATNLNAEVIAKEWNENKALNHFWKSFLQNECLTFLKMFLRYGKTYLSRKVLPSVFLLQKSPSSPVTCHSTGFFPDKAMMFWRRDGEEIHEWVEHGDLLPNDDGSFQMSVDLDVQSIPPEDWGRYECVFELSGVQNYVITKLDQDSIRSNNPKTEKTDDEGPLTTTSIAVIATIGCVIAIIIVALSFTAFRKRNDKTLEKLYCFTHMTNSTDRCSTPCLTTTSIAVIATMGCVVVIIIVALLLIVFKQRNERSSTPTSDTDSETASLRN